MSMYVISDIHGCYKEFIAMLDKINFSDKDLLILAGDYIDKGTQSYEMLRWIEHCPENIVLLRGNHEEEFAAYVDFMIQFDKKEKLETNPDSRKDTVILYMTLKYSLRKNPLLSYFDYYKTIKQLLRKSHVTLRELYNWSERIKRMPYYYQYQLKDRTCIVVHAGYTENSENVASFSSLEEFYLCAREESIKLGGKQHSMIVAGHTPTIAEKEFCYNDGNVFRYYDQEKDCIFYDIDCGCVYRGKYHNARLACIRLEDEEIFYI